MKKETYENLSVTKVAVEFIEVQIEHLDEMLDDLIYLNGEDSEIGGCLASAREHLKLVNKPLDASLEWVHQEQQGGITE